MGLFYSIMAYIALLFITAIQLYKEFKKERNWKKIIVFGILLCFALFGTLDTINRYYSPIDDKKDIITSTEKIAKDTRDHGDSTSKKSTDEIIDSLERAKDQLSLKIDSLKKSSSLAKGTIEMCIIESPNPILTPTIKADSFLFKLSICNIGKGEVFNLRDEYALVAITPDTILIAPRRFPPAFNKTVIMAAGASYELVGYLKKEKATIPNAKYFYCFKISYSDNIKKYKSWFGIYEITNLEPNVPLHSAYSTEFYRIQKFLSEQKIW